MSPMNKYTKLVIMKIFTYSDCYVKKKGHSNIIKYKPNIILTDTDSVI